MTKFKSFLKKFYYVAWRVLVIIVLACMAIFSLASLVKSFGENVKPLTSERQTIKNVIDPHDNGGLTMYCPLINYISYNSRDDYGVGYTPLYDNNTLIARYNIMGNVLTIKDIVPGNQILVQDLYYLEDLPSQDYVVVLLFRGNNFLSGDGSWNTYFEFESLEGNITFEDNISYSVMSMLVSIDSSQDLYFLFDDNDHITFLQVEFYLFSRSDLSLYFGDDDLATYSDYLSSLLVPFGFDYINGTGSNNWYDNRFIQDNMSARYDLGYDEGYREGGIVGYNEGAVDGYSDGYTDGYTDGLSQTASISWQEGYNYAYNELVNKDVATNGFLTMANLVFNAPYNILHEVFNFNILGVNVWGLLSFVFTTLLIFALIKFIK